MIIIDDDLNYLNEKINEQPNEKSNDQVKTNFNVNDLELYRRKSSFSAKDLAVKITNQTKNLNLKVNLHLITISFSNYFSILFF